MSASKVQRRVQAAGRVGWLLRNPCTVSEVAKSYSLVPQTVGLLGEQVEEDSFRY